MMMNVKRFFSILLSLKNFQGLQDFSVCHSELQIVEVLKNKKGSFRIFCTHFTEKTREKSIFFNRVRNKFDKTLLLFFSFFLSTIRSYPSIRRKLPTTKNVIHFDSIRTEIPNDFLFFDCFCWFHHMIISKETIFSPKASLAES